MIVPPASLHMPAALDFFDVPKWTARFSGQCADWLSMFSISQVRLGCEARARVRVRV